MILASEVINGADGVRVTLLDADKVTWADLELLGYLNEFQSTTAHLKPDAHTKREFIPLVAGTKQAIPDDGIAVLDIGENDGSGRMATLVDLGLLTHANRFHPAATKETDVQHWASDPRDPRRFDVTPPNNGYGVVECLYGAVPAQIATLNDPMTFPDSYLYPARCFVLAKAYSKNSKRQDTGKAAYYMNEFRQALGLKSMAQAAVAPRVASAAGAGA